MNSTDNENKLSPISPETLEERGLSDELRAFMEEEARSVSPDRIARRGFLKRVVQVSLPAGVVLGTTGMASASCVLCQDEAEQCTPSCLLCNVSCLAGCLLCDNTCMACVADLPCDTEAVLCPNGMLPMGCNGFNEIFSSPKPSAPDLEETKSDVIKRLEF